MRTRRRKLSYEVSIVSLLLVIMNFCAVTQAAQTEPPLKATYVKGKWGYADQSGRIVIAPRFDAARPFSNGLAQVGLLDEELPEIHSGPNIKWGYIDESGRVLVELRYAALRSFSQGLAAAAILDQDAERPFDSRPGLKWGYLNQDGKVAIPMQFAAAGDFSEGLAQVDVSGKRSGLCRSDRKYGYIDRSGALTIQPQFASASSFKGGRAQVSIGKIQYLGRCVCCAPRFFGKHGSIDTGGAFTIDPARRDSSSDLEFGEGEEPR